MPRPFVQLTLEQFSALLHQFPFERQIAAVHMHHTWKPDHSMYRGLASIEAMYQFHTVNNGWSDIAQHITIAPDGTIWTGRNWNDPPASSIGFNGNREFGPFMFEMIGNFDQGRDPFDGPQRESALTVTALVQKQFGLDADSLRFHNQMTTVKTCPGNSIDRLEILKAVADIRESLPMEVSGRGLSVAGIYEATSGPDRAGVRDLELLSETSDDSMTRSERLFYEGDDNYLSSGPGTRGMLGSDFSPQELSALRPHVVSMRQGQWDTGGIFNSTSADVDALFFEHAKSVMDGLGKGKKLKFVVYAHGGLVSETHGLQQAQIHIDWWKLSEKEGIYPIYFVWKTGLCETIAQLLGLASAGTRDLAIARAAITDPILAAIARRMGGESIWSGMKRDAEQAVLPGGAATYVATQMKKFCDLYPDRVELHAVGHSAGSIFQAHYIPLSTSVANPWFTTTSLMAPAVRTDTFTELLCMPDPSGQGQLLKPEVGNLTIFTMKKDFERRDNCIGIYRQSLLYLVYHAFEPVQETPILGLEECLRADPFLVRIFGLGGNSAGRAEVVWSQSLGDSGRSASRAIHHGDFSSDAPSLNSILRRILGASDTDPIAAFPTGARGMSSIWDIWAPPDDLPGFRGYESTATQAKESETSSHSVSPQPPMTVSSSARKTALCVGIDSYASPNRLTGCVHDAQAWSEVLRRNDFKTSQLLNDDATHDAIVSALRNLVSSATPGDVIVFQYSGHGTTVPDDRGRTVDGVEEAMVPVDFSVDNPNLIMDFDIAELFNMVPAGVNLTCFIDCCHSGTITRLLVGLSPQQGFTGADERPRFITLSAEEITAVQNARRSLAAVARGNTLAGPDQMHDVVFSACRPEEVAWEVNGQGQFTRYATAILSNGTGGMANQQFSEAVVQAFGIAPRQHPMLDCAAPAKSRPLLQPAMPKS
jgi:hypothetical protein